MKFEVGEIAILARSFVGIGAPDLKVGQEVEILVVGPFVAGQKGNWRGHPFAMQVSADYIIGEYPTWNCAVLESDLRKRRPPIPNEVLRVFDGLPVSEPA